MPLPSADLKLLQEIVSLGHELERSWPSNEGEAASREALARLQKLIALIEASRAAQSHDLSRLSFHSNNLTSEMSARHLAAILVPFERLLGRALRDDEFLVSENDQPTAERETAPFIVIADNLRSAFNVGAILRTAEAFGAERALLTGYTPTPDQEKTARTSMGTQEHLSWESLPKAEDAIERARAEGYTVVALETAQNAEELGTFAWPDKCALLLGNERFGIDRDLLARADRILKIPLHGRKNSLNVGIAFGIAIADYRNKLREREPKAKSLEPIGVFRSQALYPYEARRQATVSASEDIGVVELEAGHQYEQALEDLEGFERIWLLYRFHHNENWKPKVMPPRGPHTKRGVFATRSPYRPNPLGLSCVELVGIEGRKIKVKGFDLLDGTPIYDIKPYLPYADSFPTARAGWTEDLDQDIYEVRFEPDAEQKLAWLEDRGVSQIREFLRAQLEHDPLDENRKRVVPSENPGHPHVLSYRTWRATFTCSLDSKRIDVLDIRTGYSESDLASSEDRHRDKELHREFLSRFALNP